MKPGYYFTKNYSMNTLKYLAIAMVALLSACSSDNSNPTSNELDGLTLINELSNETHVVELYSETGVLIQGHNNIFLRIRNISTGNYLDDSQLSWFPLMQMTSMSHSCPYSAIQRTAGTQSLYNGYIIFQMAGTTTEFWTLELTYSIDGVAYSVEDQIDVLPSAMRRTNSFTGSDGANYLVALIEPNHPEVALNNMTGGIFKMESMMNYVPADGYTLKIDPRMPSMGNHRSPNNANLIQQADELYHGTLSLTMTGYWKINLQLLNPEGEVLKGEAISDANPASSIFFEVEF